MILVDHEIDLSKLIKGGKPKAEGSTVELTLDNTFSLYETEERDEECGCMRPIRNIDVKNLDEVQMFEWEADEVTLQPGDCILAATAETVMIPPDMTGWIGGRSLFARVFLTTHVTSPIIKPGFEGKIVLEITNLNPHHSVTIYAGMPCINMMLMKHSECSHPYQGKYQGQDKATGP